MNIHSNDRTRISFGKLSDPGVLQRSPLATDELHRKYFTSRNFQYIADHIAEMFGLAHGSIQATVVWNDLQFGWLDKNQNSQMDAGEIVMQFSMNAAINTYSRASFYGAHFMHHTATQYGYPVIFGIVAHEIGHLINRYTMATLETQIVGGQSVLMQTSQLQAHWDELCADYLAGIVLSKASPRLSQNPMIESLRYSQSDADHPDGFWRVYAIEMGHQWGCGNSPALASRILTNTQYVRQLLTSFCQIYYNQIYCAVSPHIRSQYSSLSSVFSIPCAIALDRL